MTKHNSANPSTSLGAKVTDTENALEQQNSDPYKNVCSVISKQAENVHQDMQRKLAINTQQVMDRILKESGIGTTSNAINPSTPNTINEASYVTSPSTPSRITDNSNMTSSSTASLNINAYRNTVVAQVLKLAAWFGFRPLSLPKLGVSTGTLASVLLFSVLVLPQFQSNENEQLQALPFSSSLVLLDVVITVSDEEIRVIEDLDLYETLLNEQL